MDALSVVHDTARRMAPEDHGIATSRSTRDGVEWIDCSIWHGQDGACGAIEVGLVQGGDTPIFIADLLRHVHDNA